MEKKNGEVKTELVLALAADQREGMPILCLCIVFLCPLQLNLILMNFREWSLLKLHF